MSAVSLTSPSGSGSAADWRRSERSHDRDRYGAAENRPVSVTEPVAGMPRRTHRPAALPPLSGAQLAAVFGRPPACASRCPETADLLSWLLVGRRSGPLFLTDRKAPPRVPAADLCPVTGRARMSYRRAPEIFTSATRPLDPSGRGWTLHQLSAAGGQAGRRRAASAQAP
jgi:hypothetical protein